MLRYWNPSSVGRRTGAQTTPSQLRDQYASHNRGGLLPEIVTLATSQTVPGELPTPSPFAEQHATQGLAARQATKLLSGRAGGQREVFVAAWPVAAEIFACRAIRIALATFQGGVVRCPLYPNGRPITPCLFSATLLAVRTGAIMTVSPAPLPTTGGRFAVCAAIAAQRVGRKKRLFTALQQTDTRSRGPRNLLHPPRCSITLRLGHGESLLPGGQVSLRSANFAARRFFELPHVLPARYLSFQHSHISIVFPAINPSRIPQPPPAKSTGHKPLLTVIGSTPSFRHPRTEGIPIAYR
jgi:hypothetical protein